MPDNRIMVPAEVLAEINELRGHSSSVRSLSDITDEQRAILLEARTPKNNSIVSYPKLAAWWKKTYGWGSKGSLERLYQEMMEEENGGE